jgi:hypothetical protein
VATKAQTYNGYCVKCKEKRDFEGTVEVSKTGMNMAKGKCPVCGTTVNRILGKGRVLARGPRTANAKELVGPVRPAIPADAGLNGGSSSRGPRWIGTAVTAPDTPPCLWTGRRVVVDHPRGSATLLWITGGIGPVG